MKTNIILTDREMIEKLLEGASLRTFMIPDSSIPSNYPEHIETYDLPHVIINGDFFWGKSETAHLMHQSFTSEAFCYTNIGNIFCSYCPRDKTVNLMNKRRYKKHIWSLKKNYTLIWDSEKNTATENIKKEIESCSKFKIAMLDSEDVWNIHPVDLPMYYAENGRFQLKTGIDFYPMFFRCRSDVVKMLGDYSDFFDTSFVDVTKVIKASVEGFPSFYTLSSEGTYYNLFDIPRNTTQKYKRLKIFVDRMHEEGIA